MEFKNNMSRTQLVLALIYLPLHMLVFPILGSLYAVFAPEGSSEVTVNLVYYLVGFFFCVIALHGFLRTNFDTLLDNLGRCVIAFAMSYLIYYVFSMIVSIILLNYSNGENPNDTAVTQLTTISGAMKGIGIFLAPLVEETLFRGAVFGTIREKSRSLAYIVSIALFSVYHVWQFAAASGNMSYFIYALEYVPASVALASSYERSGSIWMPIFIHMALNALSFKAMGF